MELTLFLVLTTALKGLTVVIGVWFCINVELSGLYYVLLLLNATPPGIVAVQGLLRLEDFLSLFKPSD